MLRFMKRWLGRFLEEEVSLKQKTRAIQSQMVRACVTHSRTCFIVDNDARTKPGIPEIANNIGASALEFRSSEECLEALRNCMPELIFLDVALYESDAIDVIRGLSSRGYGGAIQLFSADDPELAANVHEVGKRHQLKMLPILAKGCSDDALENVLRTHLIVAKDNRRVGDRFNTDVDLATALEFGWVEPWYQPKIDINRRALVGVEALARLNHPELGIVPPSRFLGSASLATMHRLTEHMIVTSMRDWAHIRDTGFVAKMAVNTGVDCFHTIPFAKLIRETRPSNDDWPGIFLEITEDQAIRDIALFHEIATQMQIYGVSFSIDDFGAGYSSLARLKQVPFSEIKIDGEFVRACSSDVKNFGICKAVIDLAHTYGAIATAECVDEKDDLLALHKMNCDVAQGYLLCKPLPIDKLVSVLKLKSEAQVSDASQLSPQRGPATQPQLTLQYAK